jgi:hypothetical protein
VTVRARRAAECSPALQERLLKCLADGVCTTAEAVGSLDLPLCLADEALSARLLALPLPVLQAATATWPASLDQSGKDTAQEWIDRHLAADRHELSSTMVLLKVLLVARRAGTRLLAALDPLRSRTLDRPELDAVCSVLSHPRSDHEAGSLQVGVDVAGGMAPPGTLLCAVGAQTTARGGRCCDTVAMHTGLVLAVCCPSLVAVTECLCAGQHSCWAPLAPLGSAAGVCPAIAACRMDPSLARYWKPFAFAAGTSALVPMGALGIITTGHA